MQSNIPSPATSDTMIDVTFSTNNEILSNPEDLQELVLHNSMDVTTTDDSSSSTFIINTSKPQARKHKVDKAEAISQLLTLEKKKLEHFHQISEQRLTTHEDEDYHFLLSLLPHLRNISQKRKLAIRLKLQQVLMNEDLEDSIDII
ncbi:hypothetical protein ABEB36_009289 [Hypothenemus hampei]